MKVTAMARIAPPTTPPAIAGTGTDGRVLTPEVGVVKIVVVVRPSTSLRGLKVVVEGLINGMSRNRS